MIPRPEHPKPQFRRDSWLNLNGQWAFEIDNSRSGEARGLFSTDAQLSGTITVPFCPESSLSGVNHKDFMQGLWYQRCVTLTKEQCAGRVFLHFGAVDYECIAYVNGQKAGYHKGGYVSFKFEVTDLVREGENVITVNALDDNRDPLVPRGKQSEQYYSHDCDYTRTTGIWQTVWLEAVEAAHVLSYKVFPNISAPSVVIETKTSGAKVGDTLCVKAYFEGKLMGSATVKLMADAATVEISLAEAHLWECGKGRLYDLVFELTSGEKVDVMNGYFGLREVKLTKESGLQINGKTVFGRFVLDQGFNPEGVITAPTDEALKFDIEASMACGFNGARLHQKVFEPRFLYHADKLGYMVWAEAGNWGFDHTKFENLQNFLPEWLEEVERDFSHPSVIGWCPFNETWDQNGHPQSNELLDTVYDITKAIDPTRPVITSSGSFPTKRTDVHDVHDYEQDPETFKSYYAEMDKGIARDQLWRLNRHRQVYKTELPVFMSEYGGIRWVMDEANAGWGYGASVLSEDEFFARLEGLTDAILQNEHFFGFCYTQLTDVEQEQNGLLTYDRRFKFPAEKYARIFSKKSVIEE